MHFAELPAPLHGREKWQQGFELMKRAFPDLEAHVDDLVAAEDRVAVRVSFSGTHAGEFHGMPATGRTVHYVSHEFYRVEDGLIAEEWICPTWHRSFASWPEPRSLSASLSGDA